MAKSETCFRADFHCHTQSSDGRHSPGEMYQQAVAIGLDAFAIADHNTVTGVLALTEQLSDREPETSLIPGVELSFWQGHFLVLGIDPYVLDLQLKDWQLTPGSYLDWRRWNEIKDMLRWSIDQGGLVIAAHPLMPICSVNRRQLEELKTEGLIHGAEIHNSDVEGGLKFLYPLWHQRVKQLVAELELPAFANSDAHHLDRLGLHHNRLSNASSTPIIPQLLAGEVLIEPY